MRLVRKLTAVEGLGSCAYIASDKTGTFMVNKQTVRQLTLPSGKQVSVSGEGYSGDGAILDAADNPIFAGEHAHLERLALVAIRCNEAGLTREQEEWHYHGDAVDVALPAFAYKLGLDPRWIRRDTIVVGEIPFESERRYAARLHRNHDYRLGRYSYRTPTGGTGRSCHPGVVRDHQIHPGVCAGHTVAEVADCGADRIPRKFCDEI